MLSFKMQARSNRAISIAPRMRFYVAEQRCQTGEVIDCERLPSRAVVNFESGNGRQNHTAVISHNEHGEYQVQYFDQNESRDVLQAACDEQLRSHIERRSSNQNNNQRNNQDNNNNNRVRHYDHHNRHNHNQNNNSNINQTITTSSASCPS